MLIINCTMSLRSMYYSDANINAYDNARGFLADLYKIIKGSKGPFHNMVTGIQVEGSLPANWDVKLDPDVGPYTRLNFGGIRFESAIQSKVHSKKHIVNFCVKKSDYNLWPTDGGFESQNFPSNAYAYLYAFSGDHTSTKVSNTSTFAPSIGRYTFSAYYHQFAIYLMVSETSVVLYMRPLGRAPYVNGMVFLSSEYDTSFMDSLYANGGEGLHPIVYSGQNLWSLGNTAAYNNTPLYVKEIYGWAAGTGEILSLEDDNPSNSTYYSPYYNQKFQAQLTVFGQPYFMGVWSTDQSYNNGTQRMYANQINEKGGAVIGIHSFGLSNANRSPWTLAPVLGDVSKLLKIYFCNTYQNMQAGEVAFSGAQLIENLDNSGYDYGFLNGTFGLCVPMRVSAKMSGF